jgi:hypothetical protein
LLSIYLRLVCYKLIFSNCIIILIFLRTTKSFRKTVNNCLETSFYLLLKYCQNSMPYLGRGVEKVHDKSVQKDSEKTQCAKDHSTQV